MTQVLVIGSEGFIGKSVVRKLEQNHNVRRADIINCDDKGDYYQISANTPDFTKLLHDTYPNVVINCSGSASVPLSFDNPGHDFLLNTQRVWELLEAIRVNAPAAKFVHLSSAAVYGNPISLPVQEDAVPSPVSPYGWHKYYAELACREYAKLFGVRCISLRIFSCYGPGLRKQLFWDSYKKAQVSAFPKFYGSGDEGRGFIYVDDLAKAIEVVMENAVFDGRAMNVASGQMISIRTAVETFLEYLEPKKKVNFTGEARRGDPDRWVADISYLNELGFLPDFDIKRGLERTAKWIKESE